MGARPDAAHQQPVCWLGWILAQRCMSLHWVILQSRTVIRHPDKAGEAVQCGLMLRYKADFYPEASSGQIWLKLGKRQGIYHRSPPSKFGAIWITGRHWTEYLVLQNRVLTSYFAICGLNRDRGRTAFVQPCSPEFSLFSRIFPFPWENPPNWAGAVCSALPSAPRMTQAVLGSALPNLAYRQCGNSQTIGLIIVQLCNSNGR